jgi:hypothetical protein
MRAGRPRSLSFRNGTDFLENETEQLYWRSDIVQMMRY